MEMTGAKSASADEADEYGAAGIAGALVFVLPLRLRSL